MGRIVLRAMDLNKFGPMWKEAVFAMQPMLQITCAHIYRRKQRETDARTTEQK